MFYTKYRPQQFSQISQPNDAAVALMNQVAKDKLVHAYLFVGSRGTGKTTTARILAKALNCEKVKKNGDPCDKCSVCNSIREGTFFDLIEMDAASNRGIDDIRELKNKVKLVPSVGKCKVYIIDEVHMLTTEAFNALLKTLEEPPKHCVFILCTTELHKIPTTVKSRCQVFMFKRASVAQLVEKLEQIVTAEGAKVTKKDLHKIAHAAFGGFRDAETLLQQVIEGGISTEVLLSTTTKDAYIDFVTLLLEKNINGAFRQIATVFEEGLDLYVWVGDLLKYLRELLFVKLNVYKDLLDIPEDILPRLVDQASIVTAPKLLQFIEAFMSAQLSVKTATLPQLPLELAVVDVCVDSAEPPSIAPSDAPLPIVPVTEVSTHTGADDATLLEETSAGDIKDISDIQDKWSDVLKELATLNSSIHALLKASTPIDIQGSSIILEVLYAFHKERLESAKNRKLVERALTSVFGLPMHLKCSLSKKKPQRKHPQETGNLTDYNVLVPSGSSLVDVFDGGLPL